MAPIIARWWGATLALTVGFDATHHTPLAELNGSVTIRAPSADATVALRWPEVQLFRDSGMAVTDLKAVAALYTRLLKVCTTNAALCVDTCRLLYTFASRPASPKSRLKGPRSATCTGSNHLTTSNSTHNEKSPFSNATVLFCLGVLLLSGSIPAGKEQAAPVHGHRGVRWQQSRLPEPRLVMPGRLRAHWRGTVLHCRKAWSSCWGASINSLASLCASPIVRCSKLRRFCCCSCRPQRCTNVS